ncbi:MAG TPA: hypothetical protein VNU64_15895 [Burkholderiales bacterium]|nr:hypothetical protein [Burkholderiales bacterium]
MHRILACAMALTMAAAAQAQDDKSEIEALKRRVDELEARSAAKPAANAFNPDISLILQGTAARASQNPDDYQITGFAPSGGEVAPPRRGFSLGESELVVSSNIDPYFRGQLVASLTEDNAVEVEEAFFQTLALGKGFTVKGGRFLSSIGYQNPIHQHAWDFQDAPLPYKAFLGGRLNDDGVQAKWLAPTDLLVELGAEAGRGRQFPGSDPNKNGAGMWSLFGHVGGDAGTGGAWRAGLSYVSTSPENRAFTDAGTIQSFTGDSKLWIADAVFKWAPQGNSSQTNLKLQGEYFRRTEDGALNSTDYSSRQSGWYAQAVYQFMPRWRAGYRYDRLDHGTVSSVFTEAQAPLLLTDYNPSRNTVMVDWSPTEFSRLRLQLAQDKSRAGVTDNQILLQYIFSLGAHGAHTF